MLIIDNNELDESIIKSLVIDGLLRKIPTGKETYYQLSHDRLMSPLNDDLLELKLREKTAKQQREDELVSTRKQLRKVRSLLSLAILAILAAGYFGFDAHNQKQKAQKQTKLAEIEKVKADAALVKNLNIQIAKIDVKFNELINRANIILENKGCPLSIFEEMKLIFSENKALYPSDSLRWKNSIDSFAHLLKKIKLHKIKRIIKFSFAVINF